VGSSHLLRSSESSLIQEDGPERFGATEEGEGRRGGTRKGGRRGNGEAEDGEGARLTGYLCGLGANSLNSKKGLSQRKRGKTAQTERERVTGKRRSKEGGKVTLPGTTAYLPRVTDAHASARASSSRYEDARG